MVVEEVDLVDVQDPAVRVGEQVAGVVMAAEVMDSALARSIRDQTASDVVIYLVDSAGRPRVTASTVARVPALDAVPGVVAVTAVDGGARVSVSGSPAPLLGVLSTLDVTSLRTRDSELEDVFLSYYGGTGR